MTPYTRLQVGFGLEEALASGDTDEALRIAELIDRMEPVPSASVLGAAFWYAARGLPVFPLRAGLKIPYPGSRGLHNATTDPTELRELIGRHPGCNLGLATGHGVDVLDFDGLEGHMSWDEAFNDPAAEGRHELPLAHGAGWAKTGVTLLGTVSTPRPGGMHYYVASDGSGNRAGILPGVDYRGVGGYVVVPPSTTDLGPYRWLRRLELAPASALA